MGGYNPTDLRIGTELKNQYMIEKILGQRGILKEYIAHDSFVPSIKWTLQEFCPRNIFFRALGENTDRYSNGISDDALVAPAKIRPEISKRVSDAVMKAMALDQEKRFQSMEAFEKALKKYRLKT